MESRCPDGYVSFSALAKELYREGGFYEKWNTTKNPLETKYSSTLFSSHLRWVESKNYVDRPLSLLEKNLVVEIGLFWIAAGNLNTVGIDLETGQLLRIPKFVWFCSRKSQKKPDYNDKLIADLLLGNNIAIPSINDGFIICWPLIELRSLAAAHNVLNLPPEPEILPIEWEVASAASVRNNLSLPVSVAGPFSNAAADAVRWVSGYALAMNNMGIKPKREDTLRLCCEQNGCTHRQALVAWNALPPDWKNYPRRSLNAGGLPST